MIVAGKVSGIQQFLFATNEAGGGQAKRLRSRSFLISLVAEIAALRVLRALGWPIDGDHYLLHGAGKFLLSGKPQSDARDALARERRFISEWLARHANGELQFALASGASAANPVEVYRETQQRLHEATLRPWSPDPETPWDPTLLVLEPLDSPCSLCGRVRATEDENDADTGELRRVCRWCGVTRRFGQRLPSARWLVVRRDATHGDLDLLGFGVSVQRDPPGQVGSEMVALANLQNPEHCPSSCPVDRFMKRRLMAHVPTARGGNPLEFLEIARTARGDNLLGVLVADADSLGVAIDSSLAGQRDLSGLTNLSRSLDAFFSGDLKSEIEKRCGKWKEVYTIFSGGDDLVMVGPWDVMFAFAGQLQRLFHDRFGAQGLTLSAGLALIKPKRPIKAAVAEAEHLLEIAKTVAGPGEAAPKEQCVAFGQTWKWRNHGTILDTALRFVRWVEVGQMERGWLHTLLGLVEARHPDILVGAQVVRPPNPLVTARLAHHVTRNYRRDSEARRWAEDLIRRFDETANIGARYLPAALRYALTATRTASEME